MSREDEIRKLQNENVNLEASRRQNNNGAAMIIGIIIVFIGAAFLSAILARSSTADLIPRQAVPILVFLFGIVLTGSAKPLPGLGLMLLGLIALLRNMCIVPPESFDQVWYAVLILGGLFLVLDSRVKRRG